MYLPKFLSAKSVQVPRVAAAVAVSGILILCTTAFIRPAQEHAPSKAGRRGRNLDRLGGLPMFFEENRGQAPSNARYISRSSAYDVSLFPDRVEIRSAHRTNRTAEARPLVLRLVGASEHATMRGEGQLPAKGNYFIGNDRARWQTNIGTYRKIRYSSVYPGVDVVYYGKQHELEYDFVIAPGTSPAIISWHLDGARDVKLSASGELIASLPDGHRIVERAPFSYQEIGGARVPVASRYALRPDGNIGVELEIGRAHV